MFQDIIDFLKSISFVDYIFFFIVIFLMILIICLIYFIKVNEDIIQTDEKLDNPDGLSDIISKIEKEEPKPPIKFTSYEKEQEEKAIISYDELLNNTGEYKLNYLNEEKKGDVLVKKIDLNNLIDTTSIEEKKVTQESHHFSLHNEEAFLLALKELQQKLY